MYQILYIVYKNRQKAKLPNSYMCNHLKSHSVKRRGLPTNISNHKILSLDLRVWHCGNSKRQWFQGISKHFMSTSGKMGVFYLWLLKIDSI